MHVVGGKATESMAKGCGAHCVAYQHTVSLQMQAQSTISLQACLWLNGALSNPVLMSHGQRVRMTEVAWDDELAQVLLRGPSYHALHWISQLRSVRERAALSLRHRLACTASPRGGQHGDRNRNSLHRQQHRWEEMVRW